MKEERDTIAAPLEGGGGDAKKLPSTFNIFLELVLTSCLRCEVFLRDLSWELMQRRG